MELRNMVVSLAKKIFIEHRPNLTCPSCENDTLRAMFSNPDLRGRCMLTCVACSWCKDITWRRLLVRRYNWVHQEDGMKERGKCPRCKGTGKITYKKGGGLKRSSRSISYHKKTIVTACSTCGGTGKYNAPNPSDSRD